ncbi:hypothetical protein, partial [Edwardsiella ictaluri]|uniref:hypothetical protein n=1 Tax=Edwardsiella ictaluri TaxID=67780 RepID=UPI00195548B7
VKSGNSGGHNPVSDGSVIHFFGFSWPHDNSDEYINDKSHISEALPGAVEGEICHPQLVRFISLT